MHNVIDQIKANRAIIWLLLRRILPPAIIFILGICAAKSDSATVMIVGVGLVIVAAVFLAHPWVKSISEPVGSLFYPGQHFAHPLPMYSIPASKRKSGLYEEALRGYEKLAVDYPDEVTPYIAMLEIALVDLKDQKRAEKIYEKGMSALTRPESQEALSALYLANCSRFANKKPEPRSIQLPHS